MNIWRRSLLGQKGCYGLWANRFRIYNSTTPNRIIVFWPFIDIFHSKPNKNRAHWTKNKESTPA